MRSATCPACGSDNPARWDHHNAADGGCADDWHDVAAITERADGRPDLEDMFRLIRYLREHQISHTGSVHSRLSINTSSGLDVTEGQPSEARFVDAVGGVFDADWRPLD